MNSTTVYEQLKPAIEDDNKLLHSSYLYKRSKSHNWQRRWFVLRSNQIAYYKDSKEHKASKVIDIKDVLSIAVIPDNHRFHFIIVTNKRIYHLKCSEEQDFHMWIELLNQVYTEYNKKFESQSIADSRISESQLEKLYQEDQDDDFEYTQPVNINDIDFSNFHLSGTEDNFTSGQGSDTNTTMHNASSTSLPLHTNTAVTVPEHTHNVAAHIPSPIQEEIDTETAQETPATKTRKPTDSSLIIQTQNSNSNSTNHNATLYDSIPSTSSPLATEQRPTLPQRPAVTYYSSFSSSQPERTITSGSLYRLKKRYNQWRKYYVVLTNHAMYFYKSHKDHQQGKIHKEIKLQDMIDVVELDALSKSKVYCMLIITPWKRIRFCAEDEDALVSWLVYLKTVLKTRLKEKFENDARK
ncbi:hypothetical protein WICPIJ_002733 [Wickerhamomyces pijperi]|uniref:PH domain-containing protein n=1 Tax=Wickerhamomyces pijperi TaxID=599730 RepID=A0A9P8TPJ8_WICPI|nr:hypothetical protein WICPIJ_002733 [Wickerhamomyces pijperi]